MQDLTIYLTLLIFIREEEAETFHAYEDRVLPLLPKYNGKLLYRIRTQESNFIQHSGDQPYEIHLLSFKSAQDFENYRQDKERLSHSPLFKKAVEKVILWQGKPL